MSSCVNPCLLSSFQGRRLARKRTHVHRASRNPVFNESFVFELPQNQLEHGLIDVQVSRSSCYCRKIHIIMNAQKNSNTDKTLIKLFIAWKRELIFQGRMILMLRADKERRLKKQKHQKYEFFLQNKHLPASERIPFFE